MRGIRDNMNDEMISSQYDPVKDIPGTIEELRIWYEYQELPPQHVTRFFIGENYESPKAFGIYKDGDNYVVYKNKSNGDRAVRYEGKNESYAVKEFFERLLKEIDNQNFNMKGNLSDYYSRDNMIMEQSEPDSEYPNRRSETYSSGDNINPGNKINGIIWAVFAIIMTLISCSSFSGSSDSRNSNDSYSTYNYHDYDSDWGSDYDSDWSSDWDSGATDWGSDW